MTGMTKRMTLALGAVTLAVAVGAAGFAAAQDQSGRPDRPMMRRGGPGGPGGFIGGGPGGPFGGVMLRGLDLTEAQRDQVRAIMDARRAADTPLLERARTARQALQTAIQTQPVDEATIRARHAELATVEADLAVSQAQLHAELFNVLTPEQQAELAERREAMSGRMLERRDRLQERRQR